MSYAQDMPTDADIDMNKEYNEFGYEIFSDENGRYTLDAFSNKQYIKEENNNNIIGGNKNMKYSITRSVSYNFHKSEFTVEGIEQHEFEQVKQWCDVLQKEEYKRLQLDFPGDNKAQQNKQYNNNKPQYNNNSSNNYNNNQSNNNNNSGGSFGTPKQWGILDKQGIDRNKIDSYQTLNMVVKAIFSKDWNTINQYK